ncbi:MAG: polysaccharide biosynthesis tyrosine autokinase [Deltaproteobacteria bacterium]|nr:polysaccharide biosynthesis tyrosine autokinase [Deltaproteobacteria bacterium]MBN2670116.1 polysaccharide biosynthesis tyrosine autokinase [Deltaproteobacteria bacterium]
MAQTDPKPNAPLAIAHPDALHHEDDGIDLLEYLRIVKRRWLLILLLIVVSVGVVAFFTFRMTKIYRATTTVRIETQAPKVLGNNVEDVVEMGTGSFWSNVEYYETQYKIIESRKTALAVVSEFQLHEDIDFMGLPKNEMPATPDEAAQKLQSLLTVEPVKDSRLVLVHVDHPVPEKAQLFADAIARAYQQLNLKAMHSRTIEAVDWLSERLDSANERLKSSEKQLFKYEKDNNILSISLEDRQNHITAQIQTSAQNLTQAKSKRIELQARKKAVSEVSRIDDPMAIPISELNNSALIQQLKQEYARLSLEYGELSARYGDNFPKMVELKAKMKRIKTDIQREVNNVISAIDAELREAKLTEAGEKHALEELEAEAQKLADKKGKYNELYRELQNNEQVYQLLNGRAEEAKLTKFLKVNNVEILDQALLPTAPIKPRVMLNLALAAFIGLVLGIALAIVIEVADRTIKTQGDVEAFDVSFLGIVPSIGSTEAARTGANATSYDNDNAPSETTGFDNFVFDNPKSQISESLRSIRTNLLFMSADKPISTLLVTSPSPQEGKTTVAANLSIIMAQSGAKVLIVDMDMRRPRVHKAFNIQRPQAGISTMILGETTAEESIQPSRIPNLDVLVCGPTPPNPSELIHTDAFKRVFAAISAQYDHVILDSPPVGIVTDAAILSKMVNGTLLVIKSQKTTRDALKHALNVLHDIEAPVLGAVLNDLDLTNRKYGDHFYHYYNNYGYYYGDSDKKEKSKPAKKSKKHSA